ncbi:MAG: hypothetical protein ACXIVE_14745 [Salinarimonas sp.]
MAEISGQYEGPLTLECDLVMRGRVKGTVTVPSGSRLDLEGVIMGDLVVEEGGAAIVHGAVAGALINHGGDVEVRGTVNCVHDYGERLTRFGREAKVGYDRAKAAKKVAGQGSA